MATHRTSTPIPPKKCVIARQNRIPLGTASRLESTEAPVVVKPDIVSKTAGMGSMMTPDNT